MFTMIRYELKAHGQIKGGAVPPTKRREESSKYSYLPTEGFLSPCELVMNNSGIKYVPFMQLSCNLP